MAKASHLYGDLKWSALPVFRFSVAAFCILLVGQCGIWSWDPWLLQGRSGQGWKEKWRMV